MNEVEAAYKALGLESGADLLEVYRRHRSFVAVWHPDRFTNKQEKEYANEELKKFNHARDVIKAHFENEHTEEVSCQCRQSDSERHNSGEGLADRPQPLRPESVAPVEQLRLLARSLCRSHTIITDCAGFVAFASILVLTGYWYTEWIAKATSVDGSDKQWRESVVDALVKQIHEKQEQEKAYKNFLCPQLPPPSVSNILTKPDAPAPVPQPGPQQQHNNS